MNSKTYPAGFTSSSSDSELLNEEVQQALNGSRRTKANNGNIATSTTQTKKTSHQRPLVKPPPPSTKPPNMNARTTNTNDSTPNNNSEFDNFDSHNDDSLRNSQADPLKIRSKNAATIPNNSNNNALQRSPSRESLLPFSLRDTPIGKYRHTTNSSSSSNSSSAVGDNIYGTRIGTGSGETRLNSSSSSSLPHLPNSPNHNHNDMRMSATTGMTNTNVNRSSLDMDKMRQTILDLQRHNEKLTYNLEIKELEYTKAETHIHKLLLDLDKSKRQLVEIVERMEEKHMTALFRLKEEHAKEMAILSVISVKNAVNKLDNNNTTTIITHDKDINNASSSSSSPSTIEEYIELNKKLMEQIDLLQLKQNKLLDNFADERKIITMEHNKKLLMVEKESKAELLSSRAKIIENEDMISLHKEDLSKALSKLEATTKLNRQLEKTRDELQDHLTKSNQEVKSLQQSLSSNFRFENSNNFLNNSASTNHNFNNSNNSVFSMSMSGQLNGGSPGGHNMSNTQDSVLRLTEAKADSKAKQMTNKIEFLKAQLETEQSSVEDLKNALNASQTKLNELRYDYRIRMQEIEASRKSAVEEAEKRVEEVYEERMIELTTLQSKIGYYESQISEARHENVLSKQREENLRSMITKSHAQQNALKAEVERLISQVAELKQENDKQASKVENTYQNDAIIRRLDNERQYLKSQVTAELTLKNELQKALIQVQQQLSESHRQWQNDVDVLKNETATLSQKIIVQSQNYQQSMISIEAENIRLTNHNNELKDGYLKMRDQLRVELLTLEDYQLLNKRLEEEIHDLKQDVHSVELSKSRDTDHQKQKIDEMNTLLIEKEYELTNEVINLKEELAKQFITISSAQNETKLLHDSTIQKRIECNQKLGAMKIFQNLCKMKRCRIATYFRIWNTKATLNGVAIQFRENVNSYERKLLLQTEEMKNTSLETLRNQLLKETENKIELLKKDHDDIIFNLKSQFYHDKMTIENELNSKHSEAVKQSDTNWQDKINEINISHTKEIQSIQSLLTSEIDALQLKLKIQSDDFKEAGKKIIQDARNEEIEVWSDKLQLREIELHELYKLHQTEMETDALSKFEILLKTAKMKWKKKLTDKESEMTLALEKAEKLLNHEVTKLTNQYNDEKLILQSQHVDEIRILTEQLNFNQEKALQELKVIHQETLELKLNQAQEKWESKIQIEKMNWLNSEEVKRNEEAKKSEEEFAKRLNGEKLAVAEKESIRWKQILKESEDSYESTLRIIKEDARIERETGLNSQSVSLELQYKQQMDNVLNQTREQLENLSKLYEKQLLQQSDSFVLEKNAMKDALQIQLTDQLNSDWEKKNHELIMKKEDELNSLWSIKCTQEAQGHETTKVMVNNQLTKLYGEIDQLKSKYKIIENDRDELNKKFKLLQQESELSISQLNNQFQQEKQQLIYEHNMKYDEALNQLETAHQNMLKECITKVQQDMMDENEKQLQQLQQQSELIIHSLEISLNQTRDENVLIKQQLETTGNKLENVEDTMFDLTQHMKTKEKEYSIQTWRLLTGIQKYKNQQKQLIDNVTKQSIVEKSIIMKDHQQSTNKIHNILQKLISIFTDIELKNKQIVSTLNSYQLDIMNEKRNLIRDNHVELNKLNIEYESIEAQLHDQQDEILSLQNQITQLEEQIRHHNSESSLIQNGRVNLAHGKKKKRLDEDLETILGTVEQKTLIFNTLQEKLEKVSQIKNQKELNLIEVEKSLVDLLIQQQRLVLKVVNENRGGSEEKIKLIFENNGLSWPFTGNNNNNNSTNSGSARNIATAATGALLQDDDDENE